MNCELCGENIPDGLRLCVSCAIPQHSKPPEREWLEVIYGRKYTDEEWASKQENDNAFALKFFY